MSTQLQTDKWFESVLKLDSTIRVQLHESRHKVDLLKNTFQNEYMRYLVVDTLGTVMKNDGIIEVDELPTEEEMSNIQQTLNDLKKEIKNCEVNIRDICEELEKSFEKYKASLKYLEEITEEYNLKRKMMQFLGDDPGQTLKTIQAKRAATAKIIKETDVEMKYVELDIKIENDALMASKMMEHTLQNETSEFAENERILHLCHRLADFVGEFPGIIDKGINGNTWCVSIKGAELDSSEMNLNISMKIHELNGKIILKCVEVNNFDIDLDDIISRAIELGDVKYLLVNLQRVWFSHHKFIKELETLRRCFALDWDQSSSTLKVIYGKRADIICMLQVKAGYPGNNTVTLEMVKGETEHNLEDLKLNKLDATLTDWLYHLQHQLVAE